MFTININYIINKINELDNVKKIKKAYEYASKCLGDKKRRNGETIISHSLEVANILIDLNSDITSVIAAILHEVTIYSEITKEDITDVFGKEVASIISSLEKINKLEMADDSEDSAIYLRKVMVGLSEDVRVLIIKLADRLHNMRTMNDFTKEHQKKVANETLNVLVPIAHRLGINAIKSELENLCLFYLKPDVYNNILEKLNNTVDELNDYLLMMKENISNILKDSEINFEIKGRVKSVYSIYNKLSNGRKWEDIYDILALRVFVETERECYSVVGLIHSKYRPIASRFKDYIAIPKENMYQSLHTTVIGEGGKTYEIQIRTYEMDEIAEKGIASHWSYKEKGSKKVQTIMEQKLELYRNIIENSENKEDIEFSKVIQKDILTDLIYVFTPKGDVVELPKGATPIDFAYRIHSDVGDTIVGAIVNDQIVPINSELNDGDLVKIKTLATSKPNKDWINIVKTSQARNKIKAYFSKVDKDNYILNGKNIMEKAIRKRKLAISDVLSNENIKKLCNGLKLKDLDDIYFSVGSFRYTANFIINYVTENPEEDALVVKRRPTSSVYKSDILVNGKGFILTHFAKCCNPIKGDEIVGIITKTDGIAIHRSNCFNIGANKEKEIDVSWDYDVNNYYICTLILNVISEKDRLTEIVNKIVATDVSVIDTKVVGLGIYKIDIRVKDVNDVNQVIKEVEKLRYVKGAKRI